MCNKSATIFVIITLFSVGKSRIFSRCELANELYKIHGVPFEKVPVFVCLARAVSAYSTTYHRDRNNGLFGLHDGFWCSVDSYGSGCQILCKDLRDDSISDDITCVKHVLRVHQKTDGNGFLAWGSYYRDNCKDVNKTLEYIEGCF